jgi:hypothetical protein
MDERRKLRSRERESKMLLITNYAKCGLLVFEM